MKLNCHTLHIAEPIKTTFKNPENDDMMTLRLMVKLRSVIRSITRTL